MPKFSGKIEVDIEAKDRAHAEFQLRSLAQLVIEQNRNVYRTKYEIPQKPKKDCWKILRDRGRTTNMTQFWNAITDCLEDLKERTENNV